VQWERKVEPQNEKGEIKPHAESCSNRYLIEECCAGECSARAIGIILPHPDVARVHKQRAVQNADDGKPVLNVCFELDIAGSIDERT